jgi:hypothetical protein
MSLFHNKQKNKRMIVLDVGSGTVGGAIISSPTKDGVPSHPTIEKTYRSLITVKDEVTFPNLLEATLVSIRSCLSNLIAGEKNIPTKINLVISSPWHASQTRIVTLSKQAPFTFSQKLHDELQSKELNTFEEEYKAKFDSLGDEVVILEKNTMNAKLNGYTVDNPIGKSASSVEFALFISMSPKQVLDKMEHALRDVVHHASIQYHSSIFSIFTTMRDTFADTRDFLIVDIGGELTDISFVEADVILENASFPCGRNHYARIVASELNKSIDEASTLLSLYKDGALEANLQPMVEKAIKKSESVWIKSFSQALATLSSDIFIPPNIFVLVDDEHEKWVKGALDDEALMPYQIAGEKFNVIVIRLPLFKEWLTYFPGATYDVYMGMLALYITRRT